MLSMTAVGGIVPKKVSVIVPAYNEQESIEVLAERLSEVFAANHRYEFEVILIENGSTDRTYERCCASMKKIRGSRFSGCPETFAWMEVLRPVSAMLQEMLR